MADQYLLCRAHDGSLINVAQIVGRGIQLQGRIISLAKFQELLGKLTSSVNGFSNLYCNFSRSIESQIYENNKIINHNCITGSKACVTFTDGRLADFDAISAAITAAADSASNQQPLLEDENDEYCLICSLGVRFIYLNLAFIV